MHYPQPKMNPKSPKDHETAVRILMEGFDLACTDLAHLSPNRATHLKSPKNVWKLLLVVLVVDIARAIRVQSWKFEKNLKSFFEMI